MRQNQKKALIKKSKNLRNIFLFLNSNPKKEFRSFNIRDWNSRNLNIKANIIIGLRDENTAKIGGKIFIKYILCLSLVVARIELDIYPTDLILAFIISFNILIEPFSFRQTCKVFSLIIKKVLQRIFKVKIKYITNIDITIEIKRITCCAKDVSSKIRKIPKGKMQLNK